MREIKFRAWDKCKSRMVFFDLWDSEVSIPASDSPIMQYIGLKDKNGQEIYEGDIVKWLGYEVKSGKQIRPERIMVIGLHEDPSRNSFINDCFRIQNIIEHVGKEVEVIGNIYENGDLLK